MPEILRQARAIADTYPGARLRVDEQAIHVEVENPSGFPFSLIDRGFEITLCFGNWHYSFRNEEEALQVFEKCFSGEAQLRDLTSLGIPYMGILEIYHEKSQKPVLSYRTGLITVLFLFPFPKKDRRYRNTFERA